MNYIGSKKQIFKELIKYIPEHDIYIEPFFGGGSVFFLKRKAKFNILNDINKEVFDFLINIKENKENLINEVKNLVIHEIFLKYYRNKEKTSLENAIFFILKNNFTIYSAGTTIRIRKINIEKNKEDIIKKINFFYEMIKDSLITCKDFKDFFKSIKQILNKKEKKFIYCDPPYLNTEKDYGSNWNVNDFLNLIETLKKIEKENKNVCFIVSEYENEINTKIAKEFNLNLYKIKNVIAMKKKKKTEIVLTNIKKEISLFN